MRISQNFQMFSQKIELIEGIILWIIIIINLKLYLNQNDIKSGII